MGFLKNITLFGLGALSHYYIDQWVLSPRAEIEAHLPAREGLVPQEREKTIQNMAEYLNQSAGKIQPAGEVATPVPQNVEVKPIESSEMTKVQELLRDIALGSGDEADLQKHRLFSQQAIALFNQLSETSLQERITLIDGMSRYPNVAGQEDFKQFMVSLVDRYHNSEIPDQKTLVAHTINAYLAIETDQAARLEFTEKFLRETAPPLAPAPSEAEPQNFVPLPQSQPE